MLRFAWVVCFAFCNGEYHVIRVDFIVALRRTKGRRRWTLRSPSPPSSGLHLLTPGGIRCGGVDVGCRGGQGYSQLVSGADRSSPLRRDVWVLGVRAWTVRVSVDFAGLWSFVFHWWWDRLYVPAATFDFAVVYWWDYR